MAGESFERLARELAGAGAGAGGRGPSGRDRKRRQVAPPAAASDWPRARAAIRRLASGRPGRRDARVVAEFVVEFRREAARAPALRPGGRATGPCWTEMALGLLRLLPELERLLGRAQRGALIRAMAAILASAGSEPHDEPPAGCVDRVMAPILRDRVRRPRTVRMLCEAGEARCVNIGVKAGAPPWVLAAVGADGRVLAALETVTFDAPAKCLRLSMLSGAEGGPPVLELWPRTAGAAVPGVDVRGTQVHVREVTSGEVYRAVLRQGPELLGEAYVTFET